MSTRSAAQMSWALFVVAVAAVASSGQGLAWAQAARNETATSANGEALDALLSTTSRAFSKSKCIESIRIMKSNGRFSIKIDVSFPPDDTFIPPGAEAWCDCLEDNEPDGGIPSDYEGVFDTCRDQVLVNSDYNAMDICRGMLRMYSYDFWYDSTFYNTTFCSRKPCSGGRGHYDYRGPAYDFGFNCPDQCMRELSGGYCAKYRLTYGGWVTGFGYSLTGGTWRSIAVDGSYVIWRQFSNVGYWQRDKVPTAEAICDALYPTDQGRCCTYERANATLSQCCYVKNGALEFNCAKSYGGARLRYNCGRLGYDPPYYCFRCTRLGEACKVLIDYYVAHSTYQQAKLVELPDGQTSVVFPEAFMDEFCVSSEFYKLTAYNAPGNNFTPGTREYCCAKLNPIFRRLVENCLPGAGNYASLGATRLPPSVGGPQPTPPPVSCDACSYADDKGDCKSVCKSTEECAVRKGKAVCVRCDYFRQDFPDRKNRQCCELRDGDSGTLCQSKVNNKGEKNKCFTNEGPWTNDKGAVRNPQPYTIDTAQNVCNARKNFWVNRKLCKVQIKPNGGKRCKYISKRKRNSILAGR